MAGLMREALIYFHFILDLRGCGGKAKLYYARFGQMPRARHDEADPMICCQQLLFLRGVCFFPGRFSNFSHRLFATRPSRKEETRTKNRLRLDDEYPPLISFNAARSHSSARFSRYIIIYLLI